MTDWPVSNHVFVYLPVRSIVTVQNPSKIVG